MEGVVSVAIYIPVVGSVFWVLEFVEDTASVEIDASIHVIGSCVVQAAGFAMRVV